MKKYCLRSIKREEKKNILKLKSSRLNEHNSKLKKILILEFYIYLCNLKACDFENIENLKNNSENVW